MTTFDNKNYESEVKQRFGNTDAYKEYSEKTSTCTKEDQQNINDGLMSVFEEFARCKNNGNTSDSADAQTLVYKLQNYITENYYTCTDRILSGLGQMYVADERFRNNIDKHSSGTAEFVSKAIEIYCKNASGRIIRTDNTNKK